MNNRLFEALRCEERTDAETRQLVRLMHIFMELPDPPDAAKVFPRFTELKGLFLDSVDRNDGEEIEERFLELYAHLHMHEAPYSREERRRVDATGGYWAHAGGLSPILKAEPFIRPDTVSADLGAGNGLQCLLLQRLYPHARTIQIEISGRMVEIGKTLQRWLAIPSARVEWVVGDVTKIMPKGVDFLYLYRPVRPEGPGRAYYRRLADHLEACPPGTVVFSIADCLRFFLGDEFEVTYSDGHLTCFQRVLPSVS
jgi:hypothetical protein